MTVGFSVGVGMNCLTIICISALAIAYWRANREKDAKAGRGESGGEGEKSVEFRYKI